MDSWEECWDSITMGGNNFGGKNMEIYIEGSFQSKWDGGTIEQTIILSDKFEFISGTEKWDDGDPYEETIFEPIKLTPELDNLLKALEDAGIEKEARTRERSV